MLSAQRYKWLHGGSMNKPVKAWCVFSPSGIALTWTTQHRRAQSTNALLAAWGEDELKWPQWRRRGYTCRKVIITEAK